jgi:sigma-B regulation protein RsbU (phosphoserine phosphatase)
VFRDVSQRVEFERKTQELYEHERNIADVLQGTLVPHDIPSQMYGCKLAVKYQPALMEAEVGGDFYDIFDLGNGRIGVVIGDVVGKGLAAAARVAAARHTLRSYAYQGYEPSEVMRLTNETLCRAKFDEKNMLTAFFAVIDTSSNEIAYSSAGHEPPLLMDIQGRCEELRTPGFPLGIAGGVTFSEDRRALRPGDRIVMITDGISEARADGVLLFEKRGVIEYLAGNCADTPDELVDGLLSAAMTHAGGQLQDDAAVVVFEHSGIEVGSQIG